MTQQKLMTEFPLQRIAFCQQMMKDNPQMLPEASMEFFMNAVKIGQYALDLINGDIDKVAEVKDFPDEERMNRFVDEAKYISDEKLHLIELYWNNMAKSELRELVTHIKNSYKNYSQRYTDSSKEYFLLFEYDILRMDTLSIPKAEFVKSMVYQTFLKSEECRDWVLRNV